MEIDEPLSKYQYIGDIRHPKPKMTFIQWLQYIEGKKTMKEIFGK